MNQPTAILIGAAMISVAVLIATTSSPQAQFGSGAGRYMIVAGEHGAIYRLNTSTGELRFCSLGDGSRCDTPFTIDE